MSTQVYFPNLTGLRFFAALSVIVYHYYGDSVINGHLGVILFFCLSGFLITSLLFKEVEQTGKVAIGYFLMRRVLRIWPLYYLVTIIGFLLYYFNVHPSGVVDPVKTGLFNLFFLSNALFVMREAYPGAGILWSVGSEEQFYLIWPFLIAFFRKYFVLICLLIITVFVVVPNLLDYINTHYHNGKNSAAEFTSKLLLRIAFNSMATGAFAAWIYLHFPKLLTVFFSVPFQIFLYIATIALWISNIHVKYVNDQLFATLFTLIIINLACNSRTIVCLELSWLKFLGKISYGLYVYHLAIAILLKKAYLHYLPHHYSTHLFFIVGLMLTILVSAVSYEYFEKYFLKIKDLSFSIVKSRVN
ncbi:MAG: acyltransferase [Chitinophagales bacterium]|nr:acyltransferase [Chitinophagales bacterium]